MQPEAAHTLASASGTVARSAPTLLRPSPTNAVSRSGAGRARTLFTVTLNGAPRLSVPLRT
jgi:hypothetical protein